LTVRVRGGIIAPVMQLILSLACEEARQRPDGRLDFIGVFDELQAPGFPAVQDRMTVVFVMEWTPEERGRREFRADLMDARDRKVLAIEGHTDVATHASDRPARTQLIMPLERVIFPEAGEYRFVLQVEGAAIPAFSVRVAAQPA
jgi:hypothetical protein